MNYKEEPMAWVSNLSPEKLKKFIEEWTRLRNAVYVTYPYARIAGGTINDINKTLTAVSSKKERKTYIKSREKNSKKNSTEPLSNLSVYQGKILMKLINRRRATIVMRSSGIQRRIECPVLSDGCLVCGWKPETGLGYQRK
ncbi:MAG: DUF4294 domain-containing protein [Chitinophagaceae bacterium]|nr:DUF4294 domain-containing protein [Chitinophagaceae bacterium]